MKINNIQLTSATAFDLEFDPVTPICVLRGYHSELALDLIREVMGDYDMIDDPDRIDDGRFVIHATVEMDSKNYRVCYIRNADVMGEYRLAANFEPDSTVFSEQDTIEFDRKRTERNMYFGNVFDCSSISADARLPESKHLLNEFGSFVNKLSDNDDRPLFIYDFFDRLDEAIDINPLLDKLSSLGKQVFISVCANYPKQKLKHPCVQLIDSDSNSFENLEIGEAYDNDFTVIRCPVCGQKTLDNHWICPRCGWEYDGLPEHHYSAANGATLAEYRGKFKNAITKGKEKDDV